MSHPATVATTATVATAAASRPVGRRHLVAPRGVRVASRAVVAGLGLAALVSAGACSAAGTQAGGGTSAPSGSAASPPSAPGTTAPTPGTTKALVPTYGPKACSLLTADEVAPLLGFAPDQVATTPANFLAGGYTSACDFHHPQDPDRKGKTVRVLVFPPDTPLDAARKAMTGDADLPGLGVPAFVGRASESAGTGPNTVVLDVPGQGFSITVVTGGDHTPADLTAVAQKALPRFLAQPRGASTTPST